MFLFFIFLSKNPPLSSQNEFLTELPPDTGRPTRSG